MRGFLGLRDKTQRKFEEFFEKMARMYEGKEFEVAYSDIQQSTGSANSTLKRALESMVESEVLEIQPGRNSRYGRFRYLAYQPPEKVSENKNVVEIRPDKTQKSNEFVQEEKQDSNRDHAEEGSEINLKVEELEHLTSHLLRRLRNQEMTIALLQDRVAELEDKMYRR